MAPDATLLQTQTLGQAKIEAMAVGRTLNGIFETMLHAMNKLHDLGISISNVNFDDPVTQAAWQAYQGAGQPPLMLHENEIVRAVENDR